MNFTREAPFPGASFGATLRFDGDAAQIVAAAERDPQALPLALADAKGLLLIQGMNGISDDPDLLIRLSRVFGPEVEGLSPHAHEPELGARLGARDPARLQHAAGLQVAAQAARTAAGR